MEHAIVWPREENTAPPRHRFPTGAIRVAGPLIALMLGGCAPTPEEALEPSNDAKSTQSSELVILTEAQAKQLVLTMYGKLGQGDLDGFVAGLSANAQWHVNAATLPWGSPDRVGPAGVKAFFLQVLGIVNITQFAPIPDKTIAQRTSANSFTVILKANEGLASKRDPTKTVAFTIREAVTVNTAGKITSADIYYDTGAVEHMLRAAGDIP